MTNEIPKVDRKGKYELKAASAALGVNGSTLLRYTHMGLITCGIKKCNKRRYWTGEELIRFWNATM